MLDTTISNKINKTSALLQTTGGKDEPNIVFMRTSRYTGYKENVVMTNIIIKNSYTCMVFFSKLVFGYFPPDQITCCVLTKKMLYKSFALLT